ncbi:hypothetical protein CPB85DRAFT_1427202 [Mucidula mucida]|nr:hypothetical protein CPB85DRAFT_1427202 [Mucidula mucida]
MDHNMNEAAPYPSYYPPGEDPGYSIAYAPSMSPYQVVQNSPQTRLGELQQQQQPMGQYHAMPPFQQQQQSHQYQQPQPVYAPSEQPHVMPIATSPPPPPSPDLYDPLSPPISGSDTSADGLYHHNSSGQNSPSSSRANSLVHRSVRYNPTPSPTSSSGGRRGRGRSQDSDEDDMGVLFSENLAHSRKEATRRQRIEAEQRRRDELRDGYAKLKDVLPVSNQKSSKVSLLDRATQYIQTLEKENQGLQARIAQVEAEMQHLRTLNEKIALGTDAGTPSPSVFNHSRPLSPPPEAPIPGHSLANVRGQDPPSESSSPSASEDY